jgi:hypothetical protein
MNRTIVSFRESGRTPDRHSPSEYLELRREQGLSRPPQGAHLYVPLALCVLPRTATTNEQARDRHWLTFFAR